MIYQIGQLIKVKESDIHAWKDGTIAVVLWYNPVSKLYTCHVQRDTADIQLLVDEEMEPYQGENLQVSDTRKVK